ncbi:hypoxanthine phosphoribosyltransferase [Corynebacterium sp. 13CS0277]|uniref:hypoxanthine phosphoribosyltransferase n=1 Tax=Corynebacterium sp. 13CS0277 TaxID=2071994 RepID=UPI000D03FF00|nr:hypoxanthine phosphoribosyltransferase [Corynebacterium sp. 13CS0277]PRQ11542.1 hypoxanthine phosphoribosyltransferase [Corynebacterium sp. 13CS0277]
MYDNPDTTIPEGRYHDQLAAVLIDEDTLQKRVKELAKNVSEKYRDEESVLLIGVLKGAVFFMTDFARAMEIPCQMEFMAVSSYGNSSSSSGVVRILKDLDRDIEGKRVIIVEDIIDSGLTLSWLLKNLKNRNPKSLDVVALLRKPEAVKAKIDLLDLGFDIPNEFVVGYGLDFAEMGRDLPFVASLKPEVYSGH